MRRSVSWAPVVVAVCLLTVGVLPPAAQAQDDFKRYLTAAVRLFESLEYERALAQLQRAKGLAKTVEQDVAVALHEGVILADMGQREQSLAAFREGLLLKPEAELPFKVAPKVKKDFEEVRKSVCKELGLDDCPRSPPPPKKEDPSSKREDWPVLPPQESGPGLTTPVSPVVSPGQQVLPPVSPPVESAKAARSRVPVVPVVLAGAGVVAAGVGTAFGLQSRAKVADFRAAFDGRLPTEEELPGLLQAREDAQSQARTANVMFGTAAVAVTGAIITYLLTSGDIEAASKEAR